MPAPARPRRTQTPHVSNVGRTVLTTDELSASCWTGRKFPTHLRVKASKGAYVRVDENAVAPAHTITAGTSNTNIKRAVIRLWHRLSINHTDRWMHELFFRRDRLMQYTDAGLAGLFTGNAARLRWKELVA